MRQRHWFPLVVTVVLIMAGAAVWWFAAPRRVHTDSSEPSPVRDDRAHPIQASGNPAPTASRAAPPRGTVPPAGVPDSTADENSPEADPLRANWVAVDLDEVRKALPDNLYWTFAAPTKDAQLQEWREAQREQWNVEYGKVLSGTASEAEIRAFYDQKAKLSGDYVEFTTYVLDHYGEQLPERDVSLLKLGRRLHLARIEEIPRKVEEAMERKATQDAARAAWLADQAQFGAGDDGNPE